VKGKYMELRSKNYTKGPLLLIALATVAMLSRASLADSQQDRLPKISIDTFEKLKSLIKPQRGESPWMEVDWYPNVWEARQKAAREGKPLFVWAASGGAPAAGC
jgi:hypothetical protein